MVEQASTEFADAETALAKFVLAHFQELIDSDFVSLSPPKLSDNSSGPNSVSRLPPPAAPQQPAPPALVENPRWRELKNQLDNLKRRRSELLETRLPAHPAIRSLDTSIGALESRLGELPQQLPAPNEPAATSVVIQQPTRPSPSAPATAAVAPQMAADVAERWRAAQKPNSASSRTGPIQRSRNIAPLSSRKKPPGNRTAKLLKCRLPWPQRPTPQAKANPKSAILLCGIFSLLVGFAAGSAARNSEAAFESAAEVRQQLGLTVLGLLPLAPGQKPREHADFEPHWIGRIVIGSELLLTAVVAVLIVAAVTDRQFLHALLANPLAACSQKWWC